jgi:hypothetical protein
MGNVCSGAVLAALGLSFVLAAWLGAKAPLTSMEDPISSEMTRYNRKARWPLFLFGLFFLLFGCFVMAFK